MDRNFFCCHPVEVAKSLLGKIITHHTDEGITKENNILWRPPDYLYIYVIHSHCGATKNLTNGPGRLTHGITIKNNGVKDKSNLRFYIKDNKFVSKK